MAKNRCCNVMFPSTPDKQYIFRTFVEGILPGDPVVVQTSRELAVAIFVEYCNPHSSATKYLIAKLDQMSFKASQGERIVFCQKCGEVLTDLRVKCPGCTLGGKAGESINMMMIVNEDD